MSLSSLIGGNQSKINSHFDLIGNHFISEISFIKAQRPTPVQMVVIPKTPIGTNLSFLQTQLDSLVFVDFPELKINPWRNTKFISPYLLSAFCTAFEINLGALILYYNTPTGAVPPGYPTIPIPQPIVIPAPVVPPLETNILQQYFIASIFSNVSNIEPSPTLTPELQNFIKAWSDFMVLEVFV